MANNRPYQYLLDQGYMECSSYRVADSNEITFKPLITGKGEVFFLKRLLADYLNFEVHLAEEKRKKCEKELMEILNNTKLPDSY